MQKALARLLEDLSPEAIEKKVTSSAFGSKKGRAWETFVATWEAKEKPHENGMLDVFLPISATLTQRRRSLNSGPVPAPSRTCPSRLAMACKAPSR